MQWLWALAAFWFAPSPPTFSRDVAPLLYRSCATCHHAGGVATFALTSYSDAAKRASLIAQATAKRYMPPWLPSEPVFEHEMKLSAAEIAMLGRWADAGAPEGDPRATPAPPQFNDGWTLGKPDLEAEMPAAFSVPADGPDIYECFVIHAPSARDRWVRALDIRPGNSRVVHHVILFQDTARTARQRDTGGGYSCFGTPGFLPARGLGGWTPGALAAQNPADIPELLHAGADFVLQRSHLPPREARPAT